MTHPPDPSPGARRPTGRALPEGDAWQQERWHAWYRQRPEEFSSLPEPIGLPTEWQVLAWLHALHAGQVHRLPVPGAVRPTVDACARWASSLSGRHLPPVDLWTWDPGSEAHRALRSVSPTAGFSLCAERQLRGGIVLLPDAVDELDLIDWGGLLCHEALHGAHARDADAAGVAYLDPLVAAIDELAVGFCEWAATSAVVGNGTVPTREALLTTVGTIPGTGGDRQPAATVDPSREALGRFLAAADLLTEGQVPAMCHQLSALAVAALADHTPPRIVALLDERARHRPSDGWRRLLCPAE